MNKLFTKIVGVALGASMAVGVGVAVANNRDVVPAHAAEACSWTRSGSSDTVTSGYSMVLTNYKGNADNYQDKNSSVGLDIGIKKTSGTIWSTTPSSISLTVKVGGGTTRNPLNNAVTAYLIDSNGSEVSGTSVTVTNKVESTNGKAYTVSVPVANNVAGIMVHHTKESSYNVRVFSISLSYEAGGQTTNVTTQTSLAAASGDVTLDLAVPNDSITLNATVSSNPQIANPTVSFTASPEGIVDIETASGALSTTITAVAEGTTTITASFSETVVGTYKYLASSATIEVTVQDSTPAGGDYVKVTSEPADWSGTYLLVYESGTTAYVWTGVDTASCYATTKIANSSISKPADAQTITIESMTGGYSVKVDGGDKKDKYIYGTSGSNALNFGSSAVANTISYESGVDLVSNTSHMRFNSASDNMRFRYFKAASYSSQQSVQLYKLSTPSVSIATTTPTIVYDGSNNQTVTFTSSTENFPDGPSDITYEWHSDNTSVISVTDVGEASTANLKVVGEGSAQIWVYALGESYKEATSEKVTVTVNHSSVTNLAISGTGISGNALSIESTDLTAHTITVTLTPSAPTDKKVDIAHYAGTDGLFTKSDSQITCTNGTGTFTLTGTGATSGSETFRISAHTETSVRVDLVVTALNGSVTYYTVTYSTSVSTVSPSSEQVEENGHPSLPTPTAIAHYTFNGWKLNDSFIDSSYVVVGDITLDADWTEDTKYTVTYNPNGGTVSPDSEQVYGGGHPSLPTPTKSSYSFDGWQINGSGEYITSSYEVNSSITLVAHWTEVSIVTDTLTRATTGVADGSTSYSTWSDKTSNSYAVYAGKSAGGNDSIQIRSKESDSGVITTSSGGQIKSVSVVFEANTQNGRVVNVYGKGSAYESPSDLFSSGSQGTLLGTITNGTSTSITVSGDYEYVGLCSNDGAIYLTSISFVWEGAVAPVSGHNVTFNENAGGDTVTNMPSTLTDQSGEVSLEGLNEPIRSGYTFQGWSLSSSGEIVTEVTVSDSDVEVFAIWALAPTPTSTSKRCYSLVTSVDGLVAGAKYIITNDVELETGFFAIGSQKSSNRDAEPIASEKTGVAQVSSSAVSVITLGGSTGAWTLSTADGYLFASSSSGNQLKSEESPDEDGNANWAITFTNGVASIIAQGTNTRNVMQYNYNGGEDKALFNCYASASQSAVYLYRLDFEETLLGNITCSGSGSHTLPEGYTWNTDLQGVYNDLPASEKTSLATKSAAVGSGLERYDYIIGKYNPSGETDSSKTNYVHFIAGRPIKPVGNSRIFSAIVSKNTNIVVVFVVVSAITLTSIGGYFFIRRRKKQY